jgi:transcriptional regulator with XRE-family HTH domain
VPDVFDLTASQLLRAMRGRRSQRAVARRLGYRANPITDWEHGRRQPTAAEALRAAGKLGKDVSAAFARFTPRVPLEPLPGRAPGFALGPWLRQLAGTASIAALARRTGHSRAALARWFSGESEPRLPDFLRVIDALTGRVPELIAELVPIAQVPAMEARYQASAAAKRLAFDEPWTEAILRLIETEDAHPVGVSRAGRFAERLGISREDEARCLAALTHAGIVTWEGQRYRARPLTVDTGTDPLAMRRLRHHWARVASARALEPKANDWLAYNLISCNESDLARIRELLTHTFREVRAIVAASEPPQAAALINMHLVYF